MFVYAIIVSVLTVQQMIPKKKPGGGIHIELTPLFYVPILGRVLGLW